MRVGHGKVIHPFCTRTDFTRAGYFVCPMRRAKAEANAPCVGGVVVVEIAIRVNNAKPSSVGRIGRAQPPQRKRTGEVTAYNLLENKAFFVFGFCTGNQFCLFLD